METGVRQLLDELAQGMQLGSGGLRIFVCFEDGKPSSSKVAYFRVPPSRSQVLVARGPRTGLDPELLSELGRVLHDPTERGESELVVEYTEVNGALVLHWVDLSFSA